MGRAVVAASTRSEGRSGVVAAITSVLYNTARSDGTEYQKRERSFQKLRGPEAARKRGPGGRLRQIASTAEEWYGSL